MGAPFVPPKKYKCTICGCEHDDYGCPSSPYGNDRQRVCITCNDKYIVPLKYGYASADDEKLVKSFFVS